ncbi:MAG: DUF6125 family protein [Candidatus Thermoplasmatota archaeon]
MTRKNDVKKLLDIPNEKIPDFIFLHLRNLWAVDGLYYLGIEEKWGTAEATTIDEHVWKVMGKIEARKLKEFFHLQGSDVKSMMHALQYSSWALDLEDKEIIIEENRAVIRNTYCRVQTTRLKKGLSEFACKPVRLGFLKAFAAEFNPNIKVTCTICPPDIHPQNLWCEWEFRL